MQNAVSVTSAPIKKVVVDRGSSGTQPFDKAINTLQAGDIFYFNSSSVSVRDLHSGMYLVNAKDKINNGVMLTNIDSEAEEITGLGSTLYTPDDTTGNCKIVGHLNVLA